MNTNPQAQASTPFQFADNRPETLIQKNIQQLADQNQGGLDSQLFNPVQKTEEGDSISQFKKSVGEKVESSDLPKEPNDTGLPDQLKTGIENLSGYSMDDVKVHYNSGIPAQLQAHAFAQGTDIHLAAGEEKHLPHEAWHVVQQKQGRVKPTLQMKGGVNVNDDEGLEREADFMGAKAIGMKPLQAYSESRKTDPNISNSNTVQRAVGFEFETGWLVQKGRTEAAHDDVEVSQKLEPLKKKEKIGVSSYEGFKLEADEAEGGQSEIEFITYPPIEEHASNIEVLSSIMVEVEKLGNALISKSAGKFTLDKVTGEVYDYAYVVTPRDSELKAGPQITSGIDLAKISKLASHRNAIDLAPKELKSSINSIEHSADEIAKTDKGKEVSPQLLGLLTLITNYLRVGRGQMGEAHVKEYMDDPPTRHGMALNYPKRIAEPLLSRTQFGKLFSLIPEREQIFYKKNPKAWLDLVIESAGGYKLYHPLKPVIERGIQEDELGDSNLNVKEVGPRRDEWILGIIEGSDALTKMKDSESMGEFGDKTEGVGAGSFSGEGMIEAGIFEFRGAQAQKIPLSQWKKFAVDFLKYIITLHDQSLPIPIPKKK
ncbi:DUF4157 domain-containing protein [Algoriphagus sp.]|uniref:eCIS core domain-containing protein n=1 Tax=Algoriphagus sp. TaxID=1872435 RepID=UPI002621B35C|nr:DUF4157 domain-containing protein [Algoriphagus sp.]